MHQCSLRPGTRDHTLQMALPVILMAGEMEGAGTPSRRDWENKRGQDVEKVSQVTEETPRLIDGRWV